MYIVRWIWGVIGFRLKTSGASPPKGNELPGGNIRSESEVILGLKEKPVFNIEDALNTGLLSIATRAQDDQLSARELRDAEPGVKKRNSLLQLDES